ncbi:MAG: PAS domain-containing protein [Bacillota bacterium]|nr:PAS domain-containing protein [Bacillota bacterium]
MKEFIRNFNESKLREAYRIKQAYQNGEIDLEFANAQMKAHVGSLTPQELAYIEQEFQEKVDDECIKESINEMLAIYDGVLVSPDSELPEGHPIRNYFDENRAIRAVVERIEALFARPYIKNEWDEQLEALSTFRTHLSRKQNQLYTALERKGFDRPTETMWLYDNEVRDQIGAFVALVGETADSKSTQVRERFESMKEHLLDLMQKEETILYPTSLELLDDAEIAELAVGDVEIGYALITPPAYRADAAGQTRSEGATSGAQGADAVCPTGEGFAEELGALMKRYGLGNGWTPDTPMDVKQGVLSLNRINLLFQHLPVDISYVDENELVAFYSDTKHRVFPRSKGVIGRHVKNCHPKNSVGVVEEIIEKFRSGEQDRVEFWINKPGVFIYILYVAVRDADGKFRGVMEMMQDCSHIRSLEGSQTLLSWKNEAKADSADAGEEQAPAAADASKADPQANAPQEEQGECGCSCACKSGEVPEVTPETKLAKLLKFRPQLKEELPQINPAFRMLNSPMAKVIVPIATVQMMSERSGMPIDELIAAIRSKLKT